MTTETPDPNRISNTLKAYYTLKSGNPILTLFGLRTIQEWRACKLFEGTDLSTVTDVDIITKLHYNDVQTCTCTQDLTDVLDPVHAFDTFLATMKDVRETIRKLAEAEHLTNPRFDGTKCLPMFNSILTKLDVELPNRPLTDFERAVIVAEMARRMQVTTGLDNRPEMRESERDIGRRLKMQWWTDMSGTSIVDFVALSIVTDLLLNILTPLQATAITEAIHLCDRISSYPRLSISGHPAGWTELVSDNALYEVFAPAMLDQHFNRPEIKSLVSAVTAAAIQEFPGSAHRCYQLWLKNRNAAPITNAADARVYTRMYVGQAIVEDVILHQVLSQVAGRTTLAHHDLLRTTMNHCLRDILVSDLDITDSIGREVESRWIGHGRLIVMLTATIRDGYGCLNVPAMGDVTPTLATHIRSWVQRTLELIHRNDRVEWPY